MTRSALAAALVVSLATAPIARAQPEPSADGSDVEATAKALFESASKHYDLREYPAAIDEFKKAYALLPEALFLFDIAQSYRQLHDCESSQSFYRSYLRNAPNAENRDKAQRFLDEMEQCVKDAKHPVGPGPVGGGGGEPAPSHNSLRLAGLITAAAGVVGVGIGVFFSIDASNQASDLEAACKHGCNAGDVAPIDQAGQNAQTGATISYILGGAALAAGVGIYLWSQRSEPVVVTPTNGGAMLTTKVRF